MSKLRIEGSFVASITPFNQNGEVDFGAFRTLLDFQEMPCLCLPEMAGPNQSLRLLVVGMDLHRQPVGTVK